MILLSFDWSDLVLWILIVHAIVYLIHWRQYENPHIKIFSLFDLHNHHICPCPSTLFTLIISHLASTKMCPTWWFVTQHNIFCCFSTLLCSRCHIMIKQFVHVFLLSPFIENLHFKHSTIKAKNHLTMLLKKVTGFTSQKSIRKQKHVFSDAMQQYDEKPTVTFLASAGPS